MFALLLEFIDSVSTCKVDRSLHDLRKQVSYIYAEGTVANNWVHKLSFYFLAFALSLIVESDDEDHRMADGLN